MKKQLRGFAAGFLYVFCNYFINIIPCWTVRKLLYRLCGLKIGKHSRIMMKTIVTVPWKIKIGDHTIVNEYCYLDGRGGLTIGDNVNIALYSMLVTGTHNHKTVTFDYYTEPIFVGNDVWIAVRAVVLNGCVLNNGCIVGAGSVLSPRTKCDEMTIYSGVPATKVKSYSRDSALEIENWIVHLR
jgi:maltose O-acetyltransferase